MAESSITSAVALSEPSQYHSSDALQKRRQSISSDNSNKRRRLSAVGAPDHAVPSATPVSTSSSIVPNSPVERKATNQRKPGVEEERKRNRRLFGALLGTLSQSSSSPTHRQRSEIERKQKEKLKLQDKEHKELTRKKYEDIVAERKKDQILYDRQSLKIRHSNMLAMGHFLQTKTKPQLYYRPWYLRPQDESKIQDQIAEAKNIIAREAAESEERCKQQLGKVTDNQEQAVAQLNPDTTPDVKDLQDRTDPVGDFTNAEDKQARQDSEPPATSLIPGSPAAPHDSNPLDEEHPGEVLLEDNEDAVIY